MKKILGIALLMLSLSVASCGHSSETATKTTSTSASAVAAYSDEEYALAAFAKSKGQQALDQAQLRVLTRADGLFIGDQASDTQGLVFTSTKKHVQATDPAGKTTTYLKSALQPQLQKHRADYDAALQQGKQQEKAAQAAASTAAAKVQAATAAAASASQSAGVDMKNLTTAQVQDWIMRNMAKYAPDAYTYDDPQAFGWAYSHDDAGQLVVHVSENHDYANAHGGNFDPNVAPTVGEFTVTKDGDLAVAAMGIAGMAVYQAVNGDSQSGDLAIVATDFND
ncbi:hypothetical protein ACFQ5J_07660 [Lacticaseibacillus baoqingensis]|uniref:Lipoprotein n=1 Tax=Lacticaseibacillus baoqingensis TaxID=2486013 RepID=A0ABW4E784_9LACO|nr:hypothetical protein [Lacticaseibacillus baoqingensis]